MPGRSSSSSTPDDDYKFTGHQRDAELDLDYSSPGRSRRVLARNYDPLIGRFMQVDPHYFNYTDMTPYAYVGNNPLIYTDPTGMDSTFYIRQTDQSANLTHQQKDEITNQAQSVFSQNGIPLKVKFINLNGKGNIQFIKLDPTDVRIDLVDDNNIVLKNGKKSGAISSEAEGISPVGIVTIDALTRKNINVTGVGNLVVHEGIHAMGLRHNNEGANIMNTELSGRQINRHQQIISIKHISFIIDTFLKRE
jgi:RHS repeat-associated protein